jgi:hypothetical protein
VVRIPIPNNRLVALALVGAVLTAIVAGGLAFPIPGVTESGDTGDAPGAAASTAPPPSAADAPTPNPEFTPAVQEQSVDGRGDHEAYEDDEHEETGERDGDHDEHEDEAE